MDLPVHTIAGALVGNAILYIDSQFPISAHGKWHRIKIGMACFLWGVLSHLFLDSLPYYDWLFKIDIFRPLPLYWMLPQFFTTIPVILITLHLTQDAWLIASIAMLGGIYPDIEKLVYFRLHPPKSLMVFPYHSCRLSGTPWEHEYKYLLSFLEICVFAIMMASLFRIAHRRNPQPRENLLWRNMKALLNQLSVINYR